MIRLGLRLTVSGGREAIARLLITAAAVALGVGLLLTTLAAINATNAQNSRYAWLNSGVDSRPVNTSADPLWWQIRGGYFQGHILGRVDVAATGPHAPVPPGVPRLPGPGEYYTSPALDKLLATTPAAQLADSFPGHRIGTIANSALPAPDTLIVLVGQTPEQLSQAPHAKRVTSIATTSPSSCSDCVVGMNADSIDLILSVVTGALIFPVLILIGTATRLSATRREQRFAAMRLVGATPRQISVVSAVESTVASIAGVAVGFLLFFLLRPSVATMSLTGSPFFTGDLSLNPADVLLVALGVPVAGAVAARLALRRVQISPLGVTRRVTPKPPRAYRAIPLVLGIAELAYFVGRRPATTAGQTQAFLSGFLLIMAGLIIAGPWLTMVGSRLMARRTDSPAVLIAGRRLSDNPKAGFRAVSGLILALFVTSATLGVITTMSDERSIPPDGPALSNVVTQNFAHGWSDSGALQGGVAPPSDALLTQLRSIPGINSVTELHTNPLGTVLSHTADHRQGALASCAQLTALPGFGHCAPGAAVATVDPYVTGFGQADEVWSAADLSPERLQTLPVVTLALGTDGSTAAIEQARTALTIAYPGQLLPATMREELSARSAELTGYQQLADIVVLATFPIAGCSLAVSVAGGLSERKRPFSLLRLTGVPLRLLRRVVLLESVVPLLIIAALAISTGFLAAHLFLRAQLNYSLHFPGPAFYLTTAAGLAASIAIITATLPLLTRLTGPETARNE
ncbi:hypothetical protein P3T37_003866 [Kitasatospora sp. MAA4]|uniref:FtsX-like permease family protein n=1 Tax=Kitasatospora sp. MAA4 TaxID=3035093 RepID=UPI002475A667|nr:FtsX-like permease family protein [Kitasatospora sp. MAA4]MDH6134463.1 hypothetical protein [Kitasatospora sp. MAA4]